MSDKQEMRSCWDCRHFRGFRYRLAYSMDPDIEEVPAECIRRPGMMNLVSWPFLDTKCKDYERPGAEDER